MEPIVLIYINIHSSTDHQTTSLQSQFQTPKMLFPLQGYKDRRGKWIFSLLIKITTAILSIRFSIVSATTLCVNEQTHMVHNCPLSH